VVHIGAEDEGLPEATDLRFDPKPDPAASAQTILRELAARQRLRRDFRP